MACETGHITLTTDFGLQDHYVAAMKGAILSVNPEARITDVTHLVSAQNLTEGAFALLSAYAWFPDGTVHVAVVDPGVGGERRAIIAETEHYFFVGPDNGLLSLALGKERVKRVIEISNKEYLLPDISETFHGRDIFAPVAAHLSLGIDPVLVGEEIDDPTELDIPVSVKEGPSINGEIIHSDRFGNLITNITAEKVDTIGGDHERITIEIGRTVLKGLHRTYSKAAEGELLALIGSTGYLEIAANMDSAEEILRATTGGKVRVTAR